MEQEQNKATSGFAIAGMICGIVSLIPMGLFSIAVAIVAIVLSAIAKSDIRNNNKNGAGFATAGMVCGIIAIVLWVLLIVVISTAILSFA